MSVSHTVRNAISLTYEKTFEMLRYRPPLGAVIFHLETLFLLLEERLLLLDLATC